MASRLGRAGRKSRSSRRSHAARRGSYAVPAVFVDQMAEILRKHGYGYDPRAAYRLAREGMGPTELERRIKSTKPGDVGSLEYTHGLYKLRGSKGRARRSRPPVSTW